MASFETAVANGEEYFQYDGYELKRQIMCSGCDETLEFADRDSHTCDYLAELDADEPRTHEMEPCDLLEAHLTADDEDDRCGYDVYRDRLGIDY